MSPQRPEPCCQAQQVDTCTDTSRHDPSVSVGEGTVRDGVTSLRTEPLRVLHDGVKNRTRRGLCFDCEHRAHCKLSELEEGVWHCEEYR